MVLICDCQCRNEKVYGLCIPEKLFNFKNLTNLKNPLFHIILHIHRVFLQYDRNNQKHR